MIRFIVTILLSCLTVNCFSQSDSTEFTTYDTTINSGSINWNVKITRPLHYFDGTAAVDTGHRQIIMFMCGIGESGAGNFAGLSLYGPHYWLANGWTGRVPLGNGLHFPIYISVGPYSTFPSSGSLGDLFLILYNKFKGRPDGTSVTGLSQGAMTFGQLLTIEATAGSNTFGSRIRAFVALQGSGTSCGLPDYTLGGYLRVGCDNPWITPFGTWASLGGRLFNLSGTADGSGPGGYHMAFGMNSVVAHSAYSSYETLGGGAHCCWNTMYSPDSITWGLGAGKRSYLTDAAFDTTYSDQGTYYNGSNVWQWMLRQGDTSLAGSPAAGCSTDTVKYYGNSSLGSSAAFLDLSAVTPGSVLTFNDSCTGCTATSNNFREGAWLKNIIGTPACPIKIINDPALGRPVRLTSFHGQIALFDCQYVTIAGEGLSTDSAAYGIYINHGIDNSHADDSITKGKGPGYDGINIAGRSKNITVRNTKLLNCNKAIVTKQDPFCDSAYLFIASRGTNFYLDSMEYTWNYIRNAAEEGIYDGNTGPDDTPDSLFAIDSTTFSYQQRITYCLHPTNPTHQYSYQMGVPGHDNAALIGYDSCWYEPMRGGYRKVRGNYVDSCGRGGIQISTCTVTSIQEVYYNTVTHTGMRGLPDQATGISFGTYTNPYCHDNHIAQTLGEAVVLYGSGSVNYKARIINNICDSSGYLNYYVDPYYPNYNFSFQNPGSTVNTITDARTNIKVSSQPIKYTRNLDSITVQVEGNLLGINKGALDSYYDEVPQWNRPGIQVEDYYQMFTISINNPSIICNNRRLGSGILTPYFNADTLIYSIQKSILLQPYGPHYLRWPQVLPALSLNNCGNGPYYYINVTRGIRRYFKKG